MLVTQLYTLLAQGWQEVFAQTRTLRRALEHAFALPCVLGRRTLSRTVCALGRAYQDWSADYKIFSRSRWSAEQLFDPVFDEHLRRYPQGPIAVAFDDTQLAKSGKHIPTATWHRDPMSPPFRLNLIFGLRFVQASLLFPHYREGDFATRAYPVGFQEAPSVRKPGRRAPPEALQEYRLVRKLKNLSTQTLEMLRALRERLDAKGAGPRLLLAALDGSFCNRTFFRPSLERIALVARCRKDARLCFPAPAGSPPLCPGNLHPRASPPGRRSTLAARSRPFRWHLATNPLQAGPGRALETGCRSPSPAPDRARSPAL